MSQLDSVRRGRSWLLVRPRECYGTFVAVLLVVTARVGCGAAEEGVLLVAEGGNGGGKGW